jgi:transcriptional regulator with XRE-family HTH domain
MDQNELNEARVKRSSELKALRIAAKLSANQVSISSNLKRGTINRIENGKRSWIIDSEIIYINTIEILVQESSQGYINQKKMVRAAW